MRTIAITSKGNVICCCAFMGIRIPIRWCNGKWRYANCLDWAWMVFDSSGFLGHQLDSRISHQKWHNSWIYEALYRCFSVGNLSKTYPACSIIVREGLNDSKKKCALNITIPVAVKNAVFPNFDAIFVFFFSAFKNGILVGGSEWVNNKERIIFFLRSQRLICDLDGLSRACPWLQKNFLVFYVLFNTEIWSIQ